MNDPPADTEMTKDEISMLHLSNNTIHQKAQILKGLKCPYLSHLKSCFT